MSAFPTAQSGQGRPTGGGPRRKGRHVSPLAITGGVLAAILVVIFAASTFWTEILWFDQMKAGRIIWTRWGTMAILFVIGFVAVFAFTAFCIQFAYRRRAGSMRGQAGANLRAYQEAIDPLRGLLFWGLPVLLGFTNGANLAAHWQTVLTFLNRTSFGEDDPQFGMDDSFFVFTLPFLQMIASFLFNLLIIGLIAAVIVHYLYGSIVVAPRPHASRAARTHIGLLAAGISVMFGVRYWLGRYALMTDTNGLIDGATYSQANATLPAHTILAVISLLVAVLFVVAAFRGTWRLPVIGVVVTVVSAIVIGGVYPSLIQQFRVKPNEGALESTYIQRNIDATRQAFGLEDVDYQTYDAQTDTQPGQLREDSESTSQIRLLDPLVVSKTAQQLQQSRPYYSFSSEMAVDRYTLDNERRDTVIATRELNLSGLSSEQQTWVNRHTVYTHGFGVVAAYGNTITSDGLPSYWEQSIPSQGKMGSYEPRIYFSPSMTDYSIVGKTEDVADQELDYPDDNAAGGQVLTTFTGEGGPSVGNLWNKLLYSIKFGSSDIFFSSRTNSASQILYDRDPLERVAKVAPYLTLEQKAYPAVVDTDGDPSTPKRTVWIVDGYTTTNSYPYSEHQSLDQTTVDSRSTQPGQYLQDDTVNYMRNSVKAVVDAYDGSVKLYQWDQDDPVLQTWMKVYPGTVEPLSNISGDLMSHLRYPEDLFKVQRNLLASYHVTEASQYYTGGDRWRLAQDTSTASEVNSDDSQSGSSSSSSSKVTSQPPYYLTMQMPGQDSAEFSLTSVFVPGGESKREAMAGFLAVDSETGDQAGQVREGYGKLRLIALPSSTTVPGPGQVQNLLNSNETIATQLNLLDQQGSKVIRGNLLTLPVGGGLLYVQPVYVQGSGTASYPVLRSVLTAFGSQIGFAPTLQDSLKQTFGGDSAAEVAGEDSSGGGTDSGSSGGGTDSASDAQSRLNQALADASTALTASNDAMKAGDWTAYGDAQKKLDEALASALSAQDELGQSTSGATSGTDSQSGDASADSSQSGG